MMNNLDANSNSNSLKQSFQNIRSAFVVVGGFSLVINLLLLVSPIYMLQLYDRVLTSGSRETLIMLTGIALFLLILFGLLEATRNRIMTRAGLGISETIGDEVFHSLFNATNQTTTQHTQALRDIETIRQFFSSSQVFAFFDSPWAPIFIGLIFILHPWLGFIALGGAMSILTLMLVTEFVARKPLSQAAKHSIRSFAFAESSLRNADVLKAMGMFDGICQQWKRHFTPMTAWQTRASEKVSTLLSLSKALRFMLQVAILGTGAWLALDGAITAGVIVAASIMMGRALSPIEQAIGAWRSFVNARSAYRRLQDVLDKNPTLKESLSLPRPQGKLVVENLSFVGSDANRPVLQGLNFELEAGELLGVVGSSAAGKSTLAKVLMGVIKASRGQARLDGADMSQFNDQDRNAYLGYLPQDVELFDGNVMDNIARFAPEADQKMILEATRIAGCHELILQLPQGYETQIGEDGIRLSGGQRQRIALARAVYGLPAFIVLDEPNSNMDAQGEIALLNCLRYLKHRKITVIIIAHGNRVVDMIDKILILEKGHMVKFGPRQQILNQIVQQIKS